MPEGPRNPRNEKPVSLHPLSLREALKRAMDAGKPKAEDETGESDRAAEKEPEKPEKKPRKRPSE